MLHKPLTAEGLGDHGGGSAALILPGGGQDTSQLVVPGSQLQKNAHQLSCSEFDLITNVRSAVTESTTQAVRCLAGLNLAKYQTNPAWCGC